VLTTRRRRSRLGYGQFAEVRFRDTGIGIPRDKLKKLFIPFYTTKQRGTGLGLAISHRIINQHGGTIEVRSTLGQGSTFSVFLPAAEPIPAGDVKDITETGGLRQLRSVERPDATPATPAAVTTTVGKQVESIPPGDSLGDGATVGETDASLDPTASTSSSAPPAAGEAAS
jgi:histidine kinase/DNA gyrase B/HSP90-like ATPase